MEQKDFTVYLGKTKVMKCEARFGSTKNSGKWPCGVCTKGVGSNSIKCNKCSRWIHERCSGVPDKLQIVTDFQCKRCVEGQLVQEVVAVTLRAASLQVKGKVYRACI